MGLQLSAVMCGLPEEQQLQTHFQWKEQQIREDQLYLDATAGYIRPQWLLLLNLSFSVYLDISARLR